MLTVFTFVLMIADPDRVAYSRDVGSMLAWCPILFNRLNKIRIAVSVSAATIPTAAAGAVRACADESTCPRLRVATMAL